MDIQTLATSRPALHSALPAPRPLPNLFLPPGFIRLTVEGEGEAGGMRQAGVLGVPPGADRGGEQRGARGRTLFLLLEAQEAGGLVTQQEVVLAVAKVQFPSVTVPVQAEVVEAPGVGEESRSLGDPREGSMDSEGRLGVLDGDVQLWCPRVVEEALLRLVPLAAEAEIFSEAPATGT